jgi:hypothetical protein
MKREYPTINFRKMSMPELKAYNQTLTMHLVSVEGNRSKGLFPKRLVIALINKSTREYDFKLERRKQRNENERVRISNETSRTASDKDAMFNAFKSFVEKDKAGKPSRPAKQKKVYVNHYMEENRKKA